MSGSVLHEAARYTGYVKCRTGYSLPSSISTGLIVDRTGSFVLALAIGGIVMGVGAAIYYVMVGATSPMAIYCRLRQRLPIVEPLDGG